MNISVNIHYSYKAKIVDRLFEQKNQLTTCSLFANSKLLCGHYAAAAQQQ